MSYLDHLRRKDAEQARKLQGWKLSTGVGSAPGKYVKGDAALIHGEGQVWDYYEGGEHVSTVFGSVYDAIAQIEAASWCARGNKSRNSVAQTPKIGYTDLHAMRERHRAAGTAPKGPDPRVRRAPAGGGTTRRPPTLK